MELGFLGSVLAVIFIAHLFLAYFASKEVADYPLFSLKQKITWQIIVWLLPIVGTVLAHKKLGIGWVSGPLAGGDPNSNPGHNGGCDSGGGCD